QQSTNKLSDLKAQLDKIAPADRAALNAGDLAASTYKDRVLMIPFQRVIAGWGVRKSWLAAVNEPFPNTWDDVVRVAKKFQATDAGHNGLKNVFGIAMQAGDAPSIAGGGINLLVYGNGGKHPLVDETGDVVIDRPEVAKPTIEYLKLFTEYKV